MVKIDQIMNDGEVNFYEKHKVPKQLSSKLGGKEKIIGREKELNDIDDKLKDPNALLLINGIGGIGKSTIASYYLYIQKEQFDYYGFFDGLDGFVPELRSSLGIKSEKSEEAFLEALTKLRTLEGKKLLVFDDLKISDTNRWQLERILALTNSGYKVLFTSRETIDNVNDYPLDVLSLEDTKKLFKSIYPTKTEEDEELLEKILGYLDNHAFFVEKTAYSVKRSQSLQDILNKFESGEFPRVCVRYKENFNNLLNELFSFGSLDDEEALTLKCLSSLPSIEIGLEKLQYIFQRQKDVEFENLLDYLCEKGWLGKLEGGYKLHQIIKEYIIANHTPSFEDLKIVLEQLGKLMENSSDVQVAVNNRENIVYFESLANLLERLEWGNLEVGTFFHHSGNIQYYLGEYKKAQEYYLKALEIRKKVLGTNHPDTTATYNNLAGLYELKGKYEKALEYYLKALEIREKVLGTEHPDTATTYNNLARHYWSKGKYEKALEYYLKALEIREKVLGTEHPDTAVSYHNLAIFYFGQRNFEEAYGFMKKAIDIWEKVLPPDHPNLIGAKKVWKQL